MRCKINTFSEEQVVFTKKDLLPWLCLRNKSTKKQLVVALFTHKNLVHIEKQEKIHKGQKEKRYRLYFVYSNRRGRCYVVTFTKKYIKVITIFPLGRKTLSKYRRKFK